MSWIHSLDSSLFRLANGSLSHPVLDMILPLFSGNPAFVPALLFLAAWLLSRGGLKGRVFLLVLTLVLLAGETLFISTIKETVGRLRPYHDIPDARLLAGRGRSDSLPSSHTSIWFAATLVCFLYYRKSFRFMLPMACVVGFSRVYMGMHYPGDVLAGAILGAGYGAVGVWVLQNTWHWSAPRWFPIWYQACPSLLPEANGSLPGGRPPPPSDDPAAAPARAEDAYQAMWVRAGYVLIAVMFLIKLVYLLRGKIELSEDEAYQWVWSKHLALSYFSKPPLIAYAQFLGTSLWGDNEFGVRFFSPVISMGISLMVLKFVTRMASAALAFWAVAICHTIPLLAVGSTLMTIDPLLVLFWTAAMFSGWKAVQPDGTTRQWLWTGLWLGLGFLSKYSALYQVVCWGVFLLLWKPARQHLQRPGPYLALGIMVLCSVPVLIWNAQHDWITIHHVSDNANLGEGWSLTLRYLWDFVGAEFGLLNPVFFIAGIWAAIGFWKVKGKDPLWIFLFCMGAPVFIGHLLYTFYTRVQPNWIAPAVVPLVILMVLYWHYRFREGHRWVKPGLITGVAFGFVVVLLLHETKIIERATGHDLPVRLDPLRRVRGWEKTARVVEKARREFEAEGREVFLIGGHYGITGLLSFYLPEAQARVTDRPMVYYRTRRVPKNQFYFWPGYHEDRLGQNALYVREVKSPKKPPKELLEEFETVTDLGLVEIRYQGSVYRKIQMFACRNLRGFQSQGEIYAADP